MQSVGLHLVAKVKKSSQPPSSSSSSSSFFFFFFFFFFPPFLPSIRWKKRRKVFSSSFSIYYRGKAIFLSIFNITATTRPTTARKKKQFHLNRPRRRAFMILIFFSELFGLFSIYYYYYIYVYLSIFFFLLGLAYFP